ncbi:MAG: super-infection exclusion protein B [Acidobacteriaceae bacterium]
MTWWDSTLNFLSKKIPWQIMFGLFVATGVLLFFSGPLGIQDWAHPYRGIEFTVFFFSVAVLLAYAVAGFSRWSMPWFRKVRMRRRCKEHLLNLTVGEKWVLQTYTTGQTRTAYLKMNDGVVACLVEHHVIYPASVAYTRGSTMAYNMSDFAWKFLSSHPKLVATPDKPKPIPTGNEWMAD